MKIGVNSNYQDLYQRAHERTSACASYLFCLINKFWLVSSQVKSLYGLLCPHPRTHGICCLFSVGNGFEGLHVLSFLFSQQKRVLNNIDSLVPEIPLENGSGIIGIQKSLWLGLSDGISPRVLLRVKERIFVLPEHGFYSPNSPTRATWRICPDPCSQTRAVSTTKLSLSTSLIDITKWVLCS